MSPDEVAAFERCIARGGVALFPADTVYGLAADPESASAVERLYALKGRPAAKPAAVMFFSLAAALSALPDLGARTRLALERLLPGAVTLLLQNPAQRFPLACGPRPEVLGVRVPALTGELAPLSVATRPVLQSSANLSGGPEARRLADVDAAVREGVDVALDGGELPGTPSTVVDLTSFDEGDFAIVREGAMPRAQVEASLDIRPRD